MTLFEIFDALELTALGSAIRDSIWLFPAIEALHLLALALLGGSVLVVDLRLLGLGLSRRAPSYVLAQAKPWQIAAILGLVATGVPLLLSEAVKLYFSPPFWIKMGALVLVLLFTFGIRNRVVAREVELTKGQQRAIGAVSLALWLTVATAGRWIGFS